MANKFDINVLLPAYARAQHAISSGNPVFADYAVRSLITAEEYADVRAYILDNKEILAGGKTFPNDNIAVKYITENYLTAIPVSYAAFCEESLLSAVNSGIEQYVILGAGLDTFALRESELMKKLTVFEVDLADRQELKKIRVTHAGINLPDNLKLAPADYAKTDFLEKLEKAGFDKNKKAFFKLEGQHSSEERLAEYIAGFAAEGSIVAVKTGAADIKGFKISKRLSRNDIYEKYFDGRNDTLEADADISYVLAVLKGKEEKPKALRPEKKEEKEVRPKEVKEIKITKIQSGGTKETIFKTALTMFAQRGFKAVSVRDIAGEIGITQAALYKHYTSKRDIFDSIVSFMEKKTEEAFKNLDMKQWLSEYYRYWTEDEYAVKFRKMLTVEQYGDKLSARLYEKYFTTGAVKRIEAMTGDRSKAIEIYSVIYLMMNMHDNEYIQTFDSFFNGYFAEIC